MKNYEIYSKNSGSFNAIILTFYGCFSS